MHEIDSIELQNQVAHEVPYWLIDQLGCKVVLRYNFDDGIERLNAGTVGVLDALQSAPGGVRYAVCAFDSNDLGVLSNVPLDALAPVEDGRRLSAHEAVVGLSPRAREVLRSWSHGVDLKRDLSRNTFYRYRRMLLSHGVDISCKPF